MEVKGGKVELGGGLLGVVASEAVGGEEGADGLRELAVEVGGGGRLGGEEGSGGKKEDGRFGTVGRPGHGFSRLDSLIVRGWRQLGGRRAMDPRLMPYHMRMSTREVIVSELERLPEQDLDKLLDFLRLLKSAHSEDAVSIIAAESALAKDWLTPEEDAAWASL